MRQTPRTLVSRTAAHMLKPYWISISPQELSVIEAILSERDEYVPSDRFKSAIDKLRSMVTIREHTKRQSRRTRGVFRGRWLEHTRGSPTK